MDEYNAVVRVYDPYVEVVAALRELQISGFDVNQVSIVGKDYDSEAHIIGRYHAGDRMKVWCQLGISWGGLSGLLFGSAFYSLAGIGRVIVFGSLASWIVRALEGGVQGRDMSALGAGLYSVGIPKNRIVEYETALESDTFLLVAHGTADETARADSILMATGATGLPALQRESPLPRPLAIGAKALLPWGQHVRNRLRRA
jgi:hypothetical protein